MNKIKVLSIFGTRPEAIKLAPVIKCMQNNPHISQKICVTAQHRQMLDQVLNIFNIKSDFDLDIMAENQTLTSITTSALIGLEKVLQTTLPDLILVHGDTTTTFVASLAAFYHKIKVGHIEAGLRTYNKFEPFPEEMNRKLTACMADLHFAPTNNAKLNLLKENVDPNSIFVTGNTSVDCVKSTVKNDYVFSCELLNNIDFENKKVIVVTAHRRENLGAPLENICNSILDISKSNKDVIFIYAVHFNPNVRNVVFDKLSGFNNIFLIDPIDMNDMHNLISRCFMVMTDSGGLQEEVPSFKKPTLVLRNSTERPEGVETGILKLVGTDQNKIVSVANSIINDKNIYENMINSKNPFGDGFASERIIQSILYYFGVSNEKPTNFYV